MGKEGRGGGGGGKEKRKEGSVWRKVGGERECLGIERILPYVRRRRGDGGEEGT